MEAVANNHVVAYQQIQDNKHATVGDIVGLNKQVGPMAVQIKRDFAADKRHAMNRVKEELGADASILSTRKVAGGIELTAALDYSVQTVRQVPNPELEAELRKTKEHILQAQAHIDVRVQGDKGGRERQLFDRVME